MENVIQSQRIIYLFHLQELPIGLQLIKVQGPKIWNEIPPSIIPI